MTPFDPPAGNDASAGDDTPASDLTYAQAVAELEAILSGLETDELDVDHLAERVARAAELIRECRARIDATRFHVERIVSDLNPAPDNPAADDPGNRNEGERRSAGPT